MRGKLALIFSLIALGLLIAGLAVPWFFYKNAATGGDRRGNCWFDGTCRENNGVHKNNGDAQKIYDAVLVILIVSLLPFLIFLHYVFFMKSKHHHYKKSRLIAVPCGILTWLLILAAVILFAVAIPLLYTFRTIGGTSDDRLGSPYGDRHESDRELSWGLNAGWFLTLFSLLPLLLGIIFAAIMKNHKHKVKVEKHVHTTTEYTKTAPKVVVERPVEVPSA
jgi:amino acid transporter